MRNLTTLMGLAALSSAVFAQTGKQMVSDFNKNLNSAKSLNSSYTVQMIGGAPNQYDVQLSKPNLAKIDTPWQTIVADGTTITTYEKGGKTYSKSPETEDALIALFNENDLNIWKGFFDANALMRVPDATILGQKTRNGVDLTKVKATMDMMGRRVETFYFDKADVPRQAEIFLSDQNSTTILDTSNTTLASDPIAPKNFAFKAPDGSRELSAEEMNADKWYENLNDAFAAAKAQHKMVMVEFTAVWCTWCKTLQREVFSTPEFKALSKYFVWCSIDVDVQQDVAKQYNVTAMPDIRFLTATGQQVHSVLGYEPKDKFLGEMDQARSKGGL